jgi:hypothetical protein
MGKHCANRAKTNRVSATTVGYHQPQLTAELVPGFEPDNSPLFKYGLSQINGTTHHPLKNTMAILKYSKNLRNKRKEISYATAMVLKAARRPKALGGASTPRRSRRVARRRL